MFSFATLLKNIVPAAAGIFFVCFPFLWCRARGESAESYGLKLGVSHAALGECAAVIFLILIPLTLIAVNWPGEDLPRRRRRDFDKRHFRIRACVRGAGVFHDSRVFHGMRNVRPPRAPRRYNHTDAVSRRRKHLGHLVRPVAFFLAGGMGAEIRFVVN
jgi:hypothetical protein